MEKNITVICELQTQMRAVGNVSQYDLVIAKRISAE